MRLNGSIQKALRGIFGKNNYDKQSKSEKRFSESMKNAPKNRDVSKDRFIHTQTSRIPVFTLKRRTLPEFSE